MFLGTRLQTTVLQLIVSNSSGLHVLFLKNTFFARENVFKIIDQLGTVFTAAEVVSTRQRSSVSPLRAMPSWGAWSSSRQSRWSGEEVFCGVKKP